MSYTRNFFDNTPTRNISYKLILFNARRCLLVSCGIIASTTSLPRRLQRPPHIAFTESVIALQRSLTVQSSEGANVARSHMGEGTNTTRPLATYYSPFQFTINTLDYTTHSRVFGSSCRLSCFCVEETSGKWLRSVRTTGI